VQPVRFSARVHREPDGQRRTHSMADLGIDGGVYVRLGSSTRQADPALVAELERNARGTSFEGLPEPRATLGDLNLQGLSDLRGRETTASILGPNLP
jgi:predicted HTH transcriptional regulator